MCGVMSNATKYIICHKFIEAGSTIQILGSDMAGYSFNTTMFPCIAKLDTPVFSAKFKDSAVTLS